MRSTLSVNSSVAVEANCPLRHHILSAEHVVVMFGDAPQDYFELSLAPEALRELVILGMKVLDELDLSCLDVQLG